MKENTETESLFLPYRSRSMQYTLTRQTWQEAGKANKQKQGMIHAINISHPVGSVIENQK